MMRPPRPNATKPTLGNASSSNPFSSVLNDEDFTDGGQQPAILSDTSEDEDDNDNSSVSSSDTPNDHEQRPRQRPPRPSMAAARASLLPSHSRNRRRSSARFLSLHRTSHGGAAAAAEPPANLTELYQKAIRMNAENKINAGNSWNLKLIENIDLFLGDNDEEDEDENGGRRTRSTTACENEDNHPNRKRVNFTKASCTLDASVKIYGYRVDDVHLTSYKVLANLNRSSSNDTKSNNPSSSGTGEADDGATEKAASRTKSSHNGNTLETHIANINLNKLDSAFDIDPLFHKMSKSFDEGGAKGLLLVNLGVGEQGCNIVFDSAASEHEEESALPQRTDDDDNTDNTYNEPRLPEGMMDISSLTQKLESLLLDENSTIHDLPLVPQLTGLRAEQESLEREGFVDCNALMHTVGPKTPGRRRYHANLEEEHHADRTIHKEALERSQRRSLGALNLAARLQDGDASGDDGYALAGDDDFDDYGGGGGFDDGDDDDGFDTFIQTNAPRYSDISISSATNQNSTNPSSGHTSSGNATSNFLDAIVSGQTLLSESDYSYFNEASQSGNVWAGAAHWKRAAHHHKQRGMAKKKATANKSATKKKKEPKSAKNRKVALVCLDCETPDLSHLFANKGKRKTTAATQWSKAMITKHTANENLLPEDAQVKVEQLTQLFLRPLTVLQPVTTSRENSVMVPGDSDDQVKNKAVMFHLPNWDEGSFGGGGSGDDDDGPGYDFGGGNDEDDDDEFLVQELDGVRKVEKIQVGYAVVAKQVDVKRLKRDLWLELEQKFGKSKDAADDDEDSSLDAADDDDPLETPKCVSFQKAVDDLEHQKTQMDVTLPFYFICILHLANERGLRLESQGLDDFTIHEQ